MMGKAKSYYTQWAAQFYVAAELTRRKYLVSLTLGNAPEVDLLVRAPSGRSFEIDCKGDTTKTGWFVSVDEPRANHFFVFVYLPPEGQPEYYVLHDAQVKGLLDENRVKRPKTIGLTRRQTLSHREKWDKFPI